MVLDQSGGSAPGLWFSSRPSPTGCLREGRRIGGDAQFRRPDSGTASQSARWGLCGAGRPGRCAAPAQFHWRVGESRFPRTVPATQAVLSRYADYQIERMEILGDADCDMVFVALYHENRWVRRSHIVHIAVLCAAGHRLRLCGTGAYVPPSYGGQELGAPR